MKRIISIALLLVIILSIFSAHVLAAEEIIYVNCCGNLFKTISVPFLIKNNVAYIEVENAALMTGYIAEEEPGIFTRQTDSHHLSAFEYNGTYWVNFEDAMYFLNGEYLQTSSGIYIRGLEHTVDDLLSLTDSYVLSNNYAVLDMDTSSGRLGVASAFVYNFITQMRIVKPGSWFNYDEELYKDIFADLLEKKESEEIEIIRSGKNLGEIISKFAQLESNELDFNNSNAFDIPTYSDIESVDALFSITTNLPKNIHKELFPDSEIILGGLDIFSQIATLEYTSALACSTGIYKDMVYYTYKDPAAIAGFIPDGAKKPINDFISMCESYDYNGAINTYLEETMIDFAVGTLDGTVSSIVSSVLGAPYKIIDFSMWAIDNIYSLAFNSSDNADFVEKTKCLSDMQKDIVGIYRNHRDREDYLSVKYSAMLYLQCSDLYYEYFEATGEGPEILYYDNIISELCAISDRDITFTPYLQEINLDMLYIAATDEIINTNFTEIPRNVQVQGWDTPELQDVRPQFTFDENLSCSLLINDGWYAETIVAPYRVLLTPNGNRLIEIDIDKAGLNGFGEDPLPPCYLLETNNDWQYYGIEIGFMSTYFYNMFSPYDDSFINIEYTDTSLTREDLEYMYD